MEEKKNHVHSDQPVMTEKPDGSDETNQTTAEAEAAASVRTAVKPPKKDPLSRILSGQYFQIAVRHPFITTAIISLLCFTLTTPGSNLISLTVMYAAILIAGITMLMPQFIKSKLPVKLGIFGILIVLSVAAAFYLFHCTFQDHSIAIVIMNAGLGITTALFLYFAITGTLTMNKIILLLFLVGFVIRLSYVIAMPTSMIQHDVYSITKRSGHAGYMRYLYDYGHLTKYDVRRTDQFYHPPLHHIIAALWMRLQTWLGVDIKDAFENVQLLTLFYSSACMILSYKIFKRVGLKHSGLIVSTAVIAFCPTFYFLSGSVNNDILSIAFILGAILNTLYWYRSRKVRHIIAVALCVGLGMFTKLSVWMVAPAIAFVFLYAFFSDIRHFKKYLAQFGAFLGICAPIGLFWSVRNLIRFGVPLTYVPKLSETSSQYVGDIPLTTRFFDFSFFQFEDVADQFTMYGGKYNEFNPLVGFFKTSAFDEGIATRHFPAIQGYNYFLFWAVVAAGILGFIAMIYLFVKKNVIDRNIKIFIGLLYFVFFGCYLYFCVDFPHVCTMNVRYGVPLIVIGALSLGFLAWQMLSGKQLWKKIVGWGTCGVVTAYAIAGVFVYHIVVSSCITTL